MHTATSEGAAPAGTGDALFARSPRAAWLAVASMAVGTFATVTTEFMPIGLLTNIAEGLNVSEGTAGLMVTIPGIFAALAGPALIVLSGRLDRRAVLVALSALLVVSNLLAAFAPNFGTMLVARFFLGLCVGGFWTFAPSATSHLVPAALLPRAMSIVLAGISAATVFGVPAGALLGNLAGWRAAFGVTAALAAGVLMFQMWLLPRMPPARAIRPRDLLTPLMRPMAQVGLLTVLFLIAGHFAAFTYLKPLLLQVFGLAPDAVTVLLLVYGVAGFVGTFVGGSLVARSVRGTTLSAALLIAGVLGLAVLTGGAGGLAMGAAVVVVWGLGFGLIPVAFTSWMLEAVPDAPEAGQALLVSGFQVAIALGAALGGIAVDSHGVTSAIGLGGAAALLAAIVVATLGHVKTRKPALPQKPRFTVKGQPPLPLP
ncbi:MFS transporter [Rhodoferax koreensis]|uniref:MFS transporter n=1 Tax=Rhodoferax koreensis TaxID=1842727 RepID=UPI0009FB387A|nr:MFS transporter [Rhodoferax koreense]